MRCGMIQTSCSARPSSTHPPVSGGRLDQTGRRIGKDIVQIGAASDGTTRRWMFTEITQTPPLDR
jgi:hypothetical protein